MILETAVGRAGPRRGRVGCSEPSRRGTTGGFVPHRTLRVIAVGCGERSESHHSRWYRLLMCMDGKPTDRDHRTVIPCPIRCAAPTREEAYMFFKQFYLGCLAHASYLIGDQETKTAVVVDPRRDVEHHLEEARRQGFEIRHVDPFPRRFHRRTPGTAGSCRHQDPSGGVGRRRIRVHSASRRRRRRIRAVGRRAPSGKPA